MPPHLPSNLTTRQLEHIHNKIWNAYRNSWKQLAKCERKLRNFQTVLNIRSSVRDAKHVKAGIAMLKAQLEADIERWELQLFSSWDQFMELQVKIGRRLGHGRVGNRFAILENLDEVPLEEDEDENQCGPFSAADRAYLLDNHQYCIAWRDNSPILIRHSTLADRMLRQDIEEIEAMTKFMTARQDLEDAEGDLTLAQKALEDFRKGNTETEWKDVPKGEDEHELVKKEDISEDPYPIHKEKQGPDSKTHTDEASSTTMQNKIKEEERSDVKEGPSQPDTKLASREGRFKAMSPDNHRDRESISPPPPATDQKIKKENPDSPPKMTEHNLELAVKNAQRRVGELEWAFYEARLEYKKKLERWG
ncbi:hypothetical protein EJ08DRAFT_699445 [Tothia fuscella]|uniref:Uncharacterized protein n=1 Tax=Tothia fuscella TaxID=1048955 RepID=A0A9P4NM15_9PEZI|nr:hypothetical protein EJ08DRAFT_699445 [Tothia fuscella]